VAKIFHYGGQAVIEGVMIRGRKSAVTAIRRPDGSIVVDKQSLPTPYNSWMRSMPLMRGIIVLIESLVLGIKTLMYSANIAMEEENAKEGKKDEKLSGVWIWLTLAVSLAFTVALFFLTPLFLTRLLNIANPILFNLTEGLIRLIIFVLYLWLVSFMPDIKRVFAYHGAEHKTVNGYEAGAPLEPASVKAFSKAHVRCGGSFLFVVLIIAILVFSLVGKPALWLMLMSRVVLVPVIAALGYEVIHFGARHSHNFFIKIILAPGMWVQSLTTKQPDDSQLEVAITAMKAAIENDQDTPPPVVQQSV
jgi:uncharacterized protein YqhQ